MEKDKTKIASSFRSFHLVPEAEEIFRAAKQAEQRNRRLFGRDYQNNDYVFKWPDGHPFPPDYVTRKFVVLLKKNDLRHSCASLLLSSGFGFKDVQECWIMPTSKWPLIFMDTWILSESRILQNGWQGLWYSGRKKAENQDNHFRFMEMKKHQSPTASVLSVWWR